MIKKFLLLVFVGMLICSVESAPMLAQTRTVNSVANAESIKSKVQNRVISGKKSVVVEMLNGTKMKGSIAQAGDDSFTLIDSKTNQSTVIAYRDAAKIKGSGWPTSAKIAIGVGIASAATLIVLYIAFQNAIRDN